MDKQYFVVVAIGIAVVALIAFPKAMERAFAACGKALEFVLTPIAWLCEAFRITADLLSTLRGVASFAVIIWELSQDALIPTKWMIGSGLIWAMSDALDGLLARRNGTSNYGTIADSFADKLYVSAYSLRFLSGRVPIPIRACLVISYALYGWTVFAFVVYWLWKRPSLRVLAGKFKANYFGKAKTTLQILGIANLYYLEIAAASSFLRWWHSLILLGVALPLEVKSQFTKGSELFETRTSTGKVVRITGSN